MFYPTYLVHFNKNHDSKNGQFTFGDGDGDGVNNDHENPKHEMGALGIQRRSAAKGNWHPITNPYEHSSAAGKPPKSTSKLSKSSIFKSGSFAEYKNENGKVNNSAYTISGVKKLVGGVAGIAVGKLLQNSDNIIISGAGFATETLGWMGAGYGAAQTFVGVANQVHNKRQSKN